MIWSRPHATLFLWTIPASFSHRGDETCPYYFWDPASGCGSGILEEDGKIIWWGNPPPPPPKKKNIYIYIYCFKWAYLRRNHCPLHQKMLWFCSRGCWIGWDTTSLTFAEWLKYTPSPLVNHPDYLNGSRCKRCSYQSDIYFGTRSHRSFRCRPCNVVSLNSSLQTSYDVPMGWGWWRWGRGGGGAYGLLCMLLKFGLKYSKALLYKLRSVQNTGTCYPGLGWICQVHLGFGLSSLGLGSMPSVFYTDLNLFYSMHFPFLFILLWVCLGTLQDCYHAQCPLPLPIVIIMRLIIRHSMLPACLALVQQAHETLSDIYAPGLVKLSDKMDEICINGKLSVQEPMNGEGFFIPVSNFTV